MTDHRARAARVLKRAEDNMRQMEAEQQAARDRAGREQGAAFTEYVVTQDAGTRVVLRFPDDEVEPFLMLCESKGWQVMRRRVIQVDCEILVSGDDPGPGGPDPSVTEYGSMAGSGDMTLVNVDEATGGYPLDQFLAGSSQTGRAVYARDIVVLRDWHEVEP